MSGVTSADTWAGPRPGPGERVAAFDELKLISVEAPPAPQRFHVCPICGKAIPVSSSVCECGQDFRRRFEYAQDEFFALEERRSFKQLAARVGIVLAFATGVAVGAFLGLRFISGAKASPAERATHSLESAAQAQESYAATVGRYTQSISALTFQGIAIEDGVDISIPSANSGGYCAVATVGKKKWHYSSDATTVLPGGCAKS